MLEENVQQSGCGMCVDDKAIIRFASHNNTNQQQQQQ